MQNFVYLFIKNEEHFRNKVTVVESSYVVHQLWVLFSVF